MTIASHADFRARHAFQVFDAPQFRVISGVNQGDPIGPCEALCLGDIYGLQRAADTLMLDLCDAVPGASTPRFAVTKASQIEREGTPTHAAARLTFMTPIGASVEGLLLVCQAGAVMRHYFHPLGPVEPGIHYTLIDIEHDPRDIPLAEMTAMSFGRGTRVTRADGSQVPVEQLAVGTRILTRDSGMQPIRWIGKRTVQGVGAFAPVVITKGALGNAETMTVSQQHRMMISDWRAEILVGSKDVLIRAADLVNGDTIYVRSGGFVEYTQLVFDEHQILYAEGVPTESLHMSHQILSHLPSELRAMFPDTSDTEPKFSRVPLDSDVASNLLKQTGRL